MARDKAKSPKVATIYTAFHMYRSPHEAHTGDVTVAEQIKAANRFIRWHERQVAVGKRMLEDLQRIERVQQPAGVVAIIAATPVELRVDTGTEETL